MYTAPPAQPPGHQAPPPGAGPAPGPPDADQPVVGSHIRAGQSAILIQGNGELFDEGGNAWE